MKLLLGLFRKVERLERPPFFAVRKPLPRDYAAMLQRIVQLESELEQTKVKLWWSSKERLYLLSLELKNNNELRNLCYFMCVVVILLVSFKG